MIHESMWLLHKQNIIKMSSRFCISSSIQQDQGKGDFRNLVSQGMYWNWQLQSQCLWKYRKYGHEYYPSINNSRECYHQSWNPIENACALWTIEVIEETIRTGRKWRGDLLAVSSPGRKEKISVVTTVCFHTGKRTAKSAQAATRNANRLTLCGMMISALCLISMRDQSFELSQELVFIAFGNVVFVSRMPSKRSGGCYELSNTYYGAVCSTPLTTLF